MWNIAKGLWVGVVIVGVLNLAVFMSRAAAPRKIPAAAQEDHP